MITVLMADVLICIVFVQMRQRQNNNAPLVRPCSGFDPESLDNENTIQCLLSVRDQ